MQHNDAQVNRPNQPCASQHLWGEWGHMGYSNGQGHHMAQVAYTEESGTVEDCQLHHKDRVVD